MKASVDSMPDTRSLRKSLLGWYAVNRRDLPWRRQREAYAIWISEIMLQQTRVAAVVERYVQFLERFPTVQALAGAEEQAVLALWSGLGYYRRARMLHRAAQELVEGFDGRFPQTAQELRRLPGIGAYTAAAIASIAFGEAVAVVDGNVERVLCRLLGLDAASGAGLARWRRELERQAALLLDPAAPGEFNQAMMELGALVCTPRAPQCVACPWRASCATQGEHKSAPRPAMQSREVAYALVVRDGGTDGSPELLLEQRSPEQSVMPGLWEPPLLPSAQVEEERLLATLRHAIMQVNYRVRIRRTTAEEAPPLTVSGGERRWVSAEQAAGLALTGLARKALQRCGLLPAKAKGGAGSGQIKARKK